MLLKAISKHLGSLIWNCSFVVSIAALVALVLIGVGVFYDVEFTANLLLRYKSAFSIFTLVCGVAFLWLCLGFIEEAWRSRNRAFSERAGWFLFFGILAFLAFVKIVSGIVAL